MAEALDNAVSSATVRNEMAELAALGLLTQPHTSAGRVPTAPAFRLYIDRLMPRQPLAEESRQDIDEMLACAGNDPERLVADAAGALAAITGGAVGNLIDRVRLGYVVDMIEVEFIDFPVFNVADCAVVCGAAMLVIYAFFFDESGKKKERSHDSDG